MQNKRKMKELPIHLRLPQYKKIEKIIDETKDIKTFFFQSSEIAETMHPGQFLMIYVFTYLEEPEEVPMSISYVDRERKVIGISVKIAGTTTKALHQHLVGDSIGVRGPYGQGYKLFGNRIAIVGGGVGMAPLMPLLEKAREAGYDVDVFLGARNQDHLCFVKRIKNLGANLYIATEDGSSGYKGFITDILEDEVKKIKYDRIMTSGPELMIVKILEISNKYDIPLQAGLERYIKCGRGICGQCAIDGLCVCTEGPVFSGSMLSKLSDFGKYAMDITGDLKPIGKVFNARTQSETQSENDVVY